MVSGGLLAQYSGNIDVNTGRGAIVIGLAAVIIGDVLGSAIMRGHFNFVARLSFTTLGAIIYFVVLQIVMLTGVPGSFNKLFSAVIVAIFLAVPYIKSSIKTSFRRAARNSVKSASSISEEKGAADNADAD